MSKIAKPTIKDYTSAYSEFRKNPLAEASASFIATILVIVILFMLVIRPTAITISQLQTKIEELGSLNTQLESKKRTLDKLIIEYDQLDEEVTLSNMAVPNQTNFLQIEKQIRYLTQKYSLTVMSVSFSEFPVLPNSSEVFGMRPSSGADGIPPSIEAITIALNVTGKYDDIKACISELEHLTRLITFDNFAFKTDIKNGDGDVNVSINGRMYINKDSSEINNKVTP